MKAPPPALVLVAVLSALAVGEAGRSAPAPKLDPQLKSAFQAAFGVKGATAKRPGANGTTLTYKPYQLVQLGGGTVALLSTAGGETCHACEGGFAVHYLKTGDGGLKLLGAWPELVPGSSMGEPPKIELRSDLFEGPALVSHRSWDGQGCANEYVDLVELTPSRPVVRAQRVLLTYSLEEELQPSDPHELDGKIVPGQRGKGFAVSYDGDRKFTLRYTPGKGDAWRVTGPLGQVLGC